MIDQLAPPGFFSQLRGMDYEQLLTEFNVGTAHQVCFSAEIRMRLEHELRGRLRFEGKCAMQANWLKERDAEIASLKAQLSLKEAAAAEAIHFCGQVSMVEGAEAARASELNGLKERNVALEEQVAALESAAVSKDAELASSNAQVAKVTQDLSILQLSCDELSVKAFSLDFENDKLIDHVSALETTCSSLRDEVMGYKLFKKQVEAMQDEQVKALGDRVATIDSDLMEMALHMDEEFYPRYLTTIAGRRWILSRGLKLAIMKCLQSPEYMAALGGVIGRAIDKGMQDGLAAGIDHGKARLGLIDVSAYNLFAKADYVTAINALRLAAETPEASQLQPSPEKLMIPIHRDAKARRLSFTDAMVPLIEPLSAKSLIGKASASGILVMAMATALSTTFIQTNIVPSIPSTKVPPSPTVVFEQEELDTSSEHTSAP
ncbi:hypothetical protein Tco_0545663 [Tanacetum coccineum]